MLAEIGSVSRGTSREDLIPDFISELEYLDTDKLHSELIMAIQEKLEDNQNVEKYYDSEESRYDLESLVDTLDFFAPDYCYFGLHSGGGADYGFWISGELDDFDGLTVDDLNEIDDDYTGGALVINDHGNVSLYSVTNGVYAEIWSVV